MSSEISNIELSVFCYIDNLLFKVWRSTKLYVLSIYLIGQSYSSFAMRYECVTGWWFPHNTSDLSIPNLRKVQLIFFQRFIWVCITFCIIIMSLFPKIIEKYTAYIKASDNTNLPNIYVTLKIGINITNKSYQWLLQVLH